MTILFIVLQKKNPSEWKMRREKINEYLQIKDDYLYELPSSVNMAEKKTKATDRKKIMRENRSHISGKFDSLLSN